MPQPPEGPDGLRFQSALDSLALIAPDFLATCKGLMASEFEDYLNFHPHAPGDYKLFLQTLCEKQGAISLPGYHGDYDFGMRDTIEGWHKSKKKSFVRAEGDYGRLTIGNFMGTCQDCGPCVIFKNSGVANDDGSKPPFLFALSLSDMVYFAGLRDLLLTHMKHHEFFEHTRVYSKMDVAKLVKELTAQGFTQCAFQNLHNSVVLWRADAAVILHEDGAAPMPTPPLLYYPTSIYAFHPSLLRQLDHILKMGQ